MSYNFIFDWSGTLLNDQECTRIACNKTLQHFKKPALTREQYRQNFEIPVAGFYSKLLPGVDMQKIDTLFFANYRRTISETALFDGIENMLNILVVRGGRLFILSTIDSKIVEEEVRRRNLPPIVIWKNSINKSLDLKKLIQQYDCDPIQTVMVGDTEHDIVAGLDNKVRTIACNYGYKGNLERDTNGKADFYANSSLELQQYLDQQYLEQVISLPLATVGGIIQSKHSRRICLVRTKKWGVLWGTAGGKIQYGETMEAAFYREMQEELGARLQNIQFVVVQDSIDSAEFYSNRHFILLNYYSTVEREFEFQLNAEITEARWISVGQAFQLALNKPTRKLLEICQQENILC